MVCLKTVDIIPLRAGYERRLHTFFIFYNEDAKTFNFTTSRDIWSGTIYLSNETTISQSVMSPFGHGNGYGLPILKDNKNGFMTIKLQRKNVENVNAPEIEKSNSDSVVRVSNICLCLSNDVSYTFPIINHNSSWTSKRFKWNSNNIYGFFKIAEEVTNSKSQSNLMESLSMKNPDVTLFGKGWEYRSHKEVLVSASPVFAAMFQHDLVESESGKVEILDIEQDIMKCLLYYMYTGFVDFSTPELAEKVVQASIKYQMDTLTEHCESDMIRTVSEENICARLILADFFKLQNLRERCLAIILENIATVVASEGWRSIEVKLPTVAAIIKQVQNMMLTNKELV